MNKITIKSIQELINVVRDQRVMLDSDLADLYEVETKYLNRQVRRNIERFPADFMCELTSSEYQVLKSQIGTSKTGRGGKQKAPLVFTENGVAMLSSVLRSPKAIQVNVAIMRIFTRLRSYLLIEQELKDLKSDSNRIFKIVFERLDSIEEIIEPRLSPRRKRIGL